MKTIYVFIIVVLIALPFQSCNLLSAAGIGSHGQPIKKATDSLTETTAKTSETIDHSLWNKLLKKHVNADGLVNYIGFKKDSAQLNNYLQILSENAPTNHWSVQELLAYYINLYNAGTVKLIVENYPVKSIKNIEGAWTKGRITIGNNKLSLGGIENGILRKMNEPRIHFAINCASISCPKLLNEAYTASKINAQLERVTSEFINSAKNDISANNPKLSAIFDWYRKDFKVNGKQDIIGFINQYSSVKIYSGAPISYKEYNWLLNALH